MKVRCKRLELTAEERARVDRPWSEANFEMLAIDRTYVAYALATVRGTPCVRVRSDSGYLLTIPIQLFEVVDPRPSSFWEVGFDDGELELRPPLLATPFFLDDLGERVPEVVAAFEQLQLKMEAE